MISREDLAYMIADEVETQIQGLPSNCFDDENVDLGGAQRIREEYLNLADKIIKKFKPNKRRRT